MELELFEKVCLDFVELGLKYFHFLCMFVCFKFFLLNEIYILKQLSVSVA